MKRPFDVTHLEVGYRRTVLFALELLDAVTLSRVSQGLTVVAEGLHGRARVNAGGVFVWLAEDDAAFRRIVVEPGALPYESLEIDAANVSRPLTRRELSPRVDYPFASGITGLRGTLIEERAAPSQRRPVLDAEVHLRWLDEDGVTWHDAPPVSRTAARGDFVVVQRLARTDVPRLTDGAVTVRLRARRPGFNERGSADLTLPQGRVADPLTFAQGPEALTFAWDELS